MPEIAKASYIKYTQPAFDITIDWDWVIDEAYTYNKIEDFAGIVNKNILKDLLG